MALRLVSVTRRFGGQLALDAVSLHVRRGDCYGFLGHNGAGKTTALRIALGLLRPHAGRVLVDGFDAAEHPREARARMGGLVEVPGFHGGLSGARNLELLARLQGRGRREACAEAGRVLEAVGLREAGGKPVRAYSQGMRQRLGIAQALLGSPPCVLLDEPTNGLDPEGIEEVRALLRRLTRDEGTTVLLSSHQLHEIQGVCNRVGILRQGRLLVEEETARLLGDGAGRYVLRTGDDAAASAALARLGLPAQAARDGGLEVELGAHTAGEVSRALVESGVELRAFAPRTPALEDTYLRFVRSRETRAPRGGEVAPQGAAEPAERRAPARPTLRTAQYEAARWVSSPAVPLLVAAPAVLAALAVWNRHAAAARHAAEVSRGSLASTTQVTAFEGVAAALGAAPLALAVVVAGIASQSLAGEFARGTLRNVLLRPVHRVQVAAGKALAVLGAALAGYAVLAAVALAASAAFLDFRDVAEMLPNGEPMTLVTAGALWPLVPRAFLALLPPLAAYAAVGFLAGALARTGAAALALATGSVVFLDLARAFARGFGFEAWLPSAYVPSPLGDTSYVQYFADVCQGVSNASFPYEPLSVRVPLAWAAAAFAASALALHRRSVP